MQLEWYGEWNNLATSNSIHILFYLYVNNKMVQVFAKSLISLLEFTSPITTIPSEYYSFILESTVSTNQ